jgi:menaquinone-dependent protoporphyrinogen IX oxidase
MAQNKVLVAYGTRYGSAGIVAQDIVDYLKNRPVEIDLIDLRKDGFTGSLSEYDLVVAGSSVAMFMWLGKVKRFLKKCRKAGVPTAVYITCGTAIEEEEKARSKFLDKTLGKIGLEAVVSRPIPPVIDFRPGDGLPDKIKNRIKNTIQAMAKDRYQENGLMDFRDQEKFTSFLEELGARI